MSAQLQLPSCPASLKQIQHYLKTASEHEGRDEVISYWCRLYALQSALKIDKKSDEAKMILMPLMNWLENEKKRLHENEAITNDIAAQAHIENYALKLFLWADGQDRSANFNKNVVKAFYTAGFLMDVLNTFGEQTEEIQQHCKYAKWKAAYIHNCLRNGETPIPGPVGGEEEPALGGSMDRAGPSSGYTQPSIGFDGLTRPDLPAPTAASSNSTINDPASTGSYYSDPSPSLSNFNLPSPPTSNTSLPSSNTSSHTSIPKPPPPTPQPTPSPSFQEVNIPASTGNSLNGVKLQAEQISKAQKYCKWAGSALNYDDVPEAITNLQKALKLLTTGDDS